MKIKDYTLIAIILLAVSFLFVPRNETGIITGIITSIFILSLLYFWIIKK